MPKRWIGRRSKREKQIDETLYLSGNRRGAVLKEEVWYEGKRLVKYSLAYVNPRLSSVDDGRVLGYDNSHEHHHRHFMGQTEEIEFANYESIVHQFEAELRELWRIEDEKKH